MWVGWSEGHIVLRDSQLSLGPVEQGFQKGLGRWSRGLQTPFHYPNLEWIQPTIISLFSVSSCGAHQE